MKQIFVINFLSCIAASTHMAADQNSTKPTILEARFDSFTDEDFTILVDSIENMIASQRTTDSYKDTQLISFMCKLKDHLEKESKQWRSLLPDQLIFIPHYIKFIGAVKNFFNKKDTQKLSEYIILLSYMSIKKDLSYHDWKEVRNFFKYNSPATSAEKNCHNYAHKLWSQFVDIFVDIVSKTSDEWRNITNANAKNNVYFDEEYIFYNKIKTKDTNAPQKYKSKKTALIDICGYQSKDMHVHISVTPKFDDEPIETLIFDFKTIKDSMNCIAELKAQQLLIAHDINFTNNKEYHSIIAEWINSAQQRDSHVKNFESRKINLPKNNLSSSSTSSASGNDKGIISPRLAQSAPNIDLTKQTSKNPRMFSSSPSIEIKKAPIYHSHPSRNPSEWDAQNISNLPSTSPFRHQQYLNGAYRKTDPDGVKPKNRKDAHEVPLLKLSVIPEKDIADNNNN